MSKDIKIENLKRTILKDLDSFIEHWKSQGDSPLWPKQMPISDWLEQFDVFCSEINRNKNERQ